MKNEADDDIKGYFRKKYPDNWKEHFIKQRELDGGEFHFDSYLGAGCKQYGLQRKLYDGGIIETCKLKGFKSKGETSDKLTFDMMEKLMEGYYKEIRIRQDSNLRKKELEKHIKEELKDLLINQNQIQFLCPLTNHLSEDTRMQIKKNTINKWFRVGYSKGNIQENGVVKPLIWENDKYN